MAIKLAIRRNPTFRFNYFLRSLPIDQLGRRCEQLMKAAEKEVEQLEKFAREAAGVKIETDQDVKALPPIEIPPFRVLQKQRHDAQRLKVDRERRELENKIAEIEAQIHAAQERLKAVSDNALNSNREYVTPSEKRISRGKSDAIDNNSSVPTTKSENRDGATNEDGAIGPGGEFIVFPSYDGSAPPLDWKKAFTQYCNHTKKDLKESLPPEERKNKVSG
jgi:hypothetical protein